VIRLWSLRTLRQIRQFAGHSDAVFSVAFSPNGRLLASGSADDTVRLWNVYAPTSATGSIGQPLTGHHGYVWTVAFSPDGTTLASGSEDGTTRLWDVASRTQIGQPLGVDPLRIATVAFSRNGESLLSGGRDGVVHIWPVVVLPRDYAALRARVCGIVGPGLSPAEWSDYAPRSDYANPCS
jgi:WD40 repeat protein